MSSQEAVHVSLMEVMPTSGKGTLGTWWFHFQRGGRTQSRHQPTHELELSYEQTIRSRGVCAPALKPRGEWEGSRTKCQGFKPDLGNSAVRHYRGAFENVARVEMRTQLAIERAGLVTLHLQPARRSSIPTNDRRVKTRYRLITEITSELPAISQRKWASLSLPIAVRSHRPSRNRLR
jgi:hypothetical protein